MRRDLVKIGGIDSSFLSCEKDTEIILRRLFIDSRPYSDYLKRLLLINTPDCLDDMTNPKYLDIIKMINKQSLPIYEIKEKCLIQKMNNK